MSSSWARFRNFEFAFKGLAVIDRKTKEAASNDSTKMRDEIEKKISDEGKRTGAFPPGLPNVITKLSHSVWIAQ